MAYLSFCKFKTDTGDKGCAEMARDGKGYCYPHLVDELEAKLAEADRKYTEDIVYLDKKLADYPLAMSNLRAENAELRDWVRSGAISLEWIAESSKDSSIKVYAEESAKILRSKS